MLLDAIATAILAGLMLIPLVNVIAGGVVGAGLAGPLGGLFGIVLAIAITALETWVADCLGWRDLHHEPAGALAPADEVSPTTERTIKTGPPSPRRQSRHAQEAKPVRRAMQTRKMQRGAAR